jgi:hypothetical protein
MYSWGEEGQPEIFLHIPYSIIFTLSYFKEPIVIIYFKLYPCICNYPCASAGC